MFGLNRGKLTPYPGRRLRGHPPSTVQIDCFLRKNLPTFSGLKVDLDAAVHSPVHFQIAGAREFSRGPSRAGRSGVTALSR